MTTRKTPLPEHVEIGHRIRAARLVADISQSDLGKHLGLTFQQVQKYESGTNRIDPVRLKKACEFLQADVAEVMGIKGKRPERAKDHDRLLATYEIAETIKEMSNMTPKQRKFVLDVAKRTRAVVPAS
jgi:transcriptional regulator with XRE-family HTH domain